MTMARLFYVHWNREEALGAVRDLREAGHTVLAHYRTEQGAGADAWKKIKARPPDALVVSLTRLPSHGRRIAAVTLETRKLADVPVVFVDGEAEKVKAARRQFPSATFTTSARLGSVLERFGAGERP